MEKIKLKHCATEITKKYKLINKLELLLSEIHRRRLENQNLERDLQTKELELQELDQKLEKLNGKYENQLQFIEDTQLNLSADKFELEKKLLANRRYIKEEYIPIVSKEIAPKQKKICRDLINIYPISSELTQFLDIKMPLKPELTIHQASLLENINNQDSSRFKNAFTRRKTTKKIQMNELTMTQFAGEQLVRLLLTQKYVLDWPLRFPVSLLSNNYLDTEHLAQSNFLQDTDQKQESGGIIQNSLYKNIKIASYSSKDRIEFLDAVALLHCNFFDLEWIAKDKGAKMILTKGHVRKFWKIVESSMEINKIREVSEDVEKTSSVSTTRSNQDSSANTWEQSRELPMITGLYNGGLVNSSDNKKNRLVDRSKLFS